VWFLEEILPEIVKTYGPLKFRIVGRICRDKSVISAAHAFGEMIEMRGFVKDIAPEYPLVKVWVAPIRYGTGMKIKVAEALAMRAAVVGTSSAFESIDVEDASSAMIADGAAEFALKVKHLLNDEDMRQRISSEAYSVYVRDHGFQAHVSRLRDVITNKAEPAPAE
jgi:polysaccharide biosynthesis protein PslH